MQSHELMNGFPPDPQRQVTVANWLEAPFNRWSFQNVRNLVPTALVRRGGGPIRRLKRRPRNLPALEFESPDGRTLTIEEMIGETWTDALVVLHRGQIVLERYENGMTPDTPHIMFSVTKSVTATLAGRLVSEGMLDPDLPVTGYVPEVAESAYGDATVRHLLDMTVGIRFDEDYEATSGDMHLYRVATGWRIGESGAGLREFIPTLPKEGEHGHMFHYVSPNTDLLGWVIERASGRSLVELLSDWLWAPMGAEHDAYLGVDPFGAPRAAGGLCTSARDLARFGQLMLERGFAGDAQVIPSAWIDDILHAGDPQAWERGSLAEEMPDVCYRSQWYRHGDGAIFGLGVYGQCVYVDPSAELVAAKFSSQPSPLDLSFDLLSHAGLRAIADSLR